MTEHAPEPTSVVSARQGVEDFHRRVMMFGGGVIAFVAGIGGAAALQAPQPVLIGLIGSYFAFALGGAFSLRKSRFKAHQHVIREWESRGLKEEFARFDRAADGGADPRMAAAASMGGRIRALQASDPATDAMVTRLEERLKRLVSDQVAAAAAVRALEAAGAGEHGTGRLAEAAQRLDDEIGRILGGLSELYAALLEAEAGGADATAPLGDLMAWLAAEAEVSRAAHGVEAMRPARQRTTAS